MRESAARGCMNLSSRPSDFVDRLDHRDLIVVVVDGEERGEAAAKLAERSAFAPQQAHAKGVESGDGGRALGAGGDQGAHAVAHFAGGFVGESDGQNGPSGNPVRGHQVGDAVGDHPGFPAAGAGQHQQGAFGVLDRLPLAGVQPLEKIHQSDFTTIVYPHLRVWYITTGIVADVVSITPARFSEIHNLKKCPCFRRPPRDVRSNPARLIYGIESRLDEAIAH